MNWTKNHGPPPLITDNGYILLIHNAAAKDPDGKLIYRAGQALIDPAKPTEELARLTTPFLVPETPEETEGQVNKVVFVEGLVDWRGEWLLYYGQGVGPVVPADREEAGELALRPGVRLDRDPVVARHLGQPSFEVARSAGW